MYTIKDKMYPSRTYMYDGRIVQFENYQADVSPEVAYRMSRVSRPEEFEIPDQSVVPFNSDSWKKERRMIWNSNVSSANGFGHVSEQVILSLLRQGVTVLNPGSISGALVFGGEFVDKMIEKSLNKIIIPDCLEVQYAQPPSIRTDIVERVIGYCMYETSVTPRSWIKKMNQLSHVLVPSQWLVDSWKEQGLKTPISVFSHGVDPKIYFYMDRPDREVYTFLHFGQLARRKGTDLVVRAFLEEFTKRDDVRLVLKGNGPIIDGMPKEYLSLIMSDSFLPEGEFGESRIKWIHGPYSKQRMNQLFFNSDCFVFPTRGEGFGLTPLEALATGLPTIVTGWSGPVDYSDPDDTLILDYEMVRSYEFDMIYKDSYEKSENAGYWAEPNITTLKERMRWCYENRDKAKKMGRKAAERVRKSWSWDAVVNRQLLPLLDRYL